MTILNSCFCIVYITHIFVDDEYYSHCGIFVHQLIIDFESNYRIFSKFLSQNLDFYRENSDILGVVHLHILERKFKVFVNFDF